MGREVTWFDPRFLAGPAQIVVGLFLLTITARLWFVHPVNRVFRLGGFITERGMKALLNMRIVLFSFGMTLLTGGLNRVAYWFFLREVYHPVVVFFGSMEAVMAIWSAALAIVAGVRLWRVR